MRGFETELRELASSLDLPEPVRSRVLLELRWDLESMAAALAAEGVGEAEARRRALAALLPSPEAVVELGSVHRPLYQRLVDHFSDAGRHRLERGLLAGLVVTQLVAGLAVLGRMELLEGPSPFLWPLLGLALLIVGLAAAKLFQLFVAGGPAGAGLRRGLVPLLLLGAAVLVVGFGGVVVDFHQVAGRLAADPDRQMAELVAWLRRDAALLLVALLAAWVAGVSWLVASVRIARIEQTEWVALELTIPDRRTT